MQFPRVHIISRKPEIAYLITKTLAKTGFNVTSTSGDDISAKSINEVEGIVECLIFDKDIDTEIKNEAKRKFSSAKIICLPSLGSSSGLSDDVEYMSEPLRLSELTKFIFDMFHLKNT